MLDELKAVIIDCFPELAKSSFSLLTAGWDSVAVDVDDRLIFKFPRDEELATALRREAAMLAVIRPRVTLSVPDLQFFEQPRPFSRHSKLPGDHLTTERYNTLSEIYRNKLAGEVACLYAELHNLDSAQLEAAGAQPLDPWIAPDVIWAQVEPLLPMAAKPAAQRILTAASLLPDDPYGIRYGFFDGHGWNMAFDTSSTTLNGIYDFGDAGFGDLHQEFIYTNFISPDLTARVIKTYGQLTNRTIDHSRVATLFGVLLLTELGDMNDNSDYGPTVLQNALNWLATQ